MRIIVLKDKRVITILDIQKYIIETIVKAHGGDSWVETKVDSEFDNLKVGDLLLTDRETDSLVVHEKR